MTIRCTQAALLILLCSTAAHAQANPTQKPTPGASQQFPYPGEAPETKALDPKTPDPKTPDPKSPDAPTAPAPAPAPAPDAKSVKDRFPYPGEKSEAPDATAPIPDPAHSGESSSSSSSSSDIPPDVDGKPNLKDEGTQGTTARQRRRLRPPAQKILSDEERVQEDLTVAHFYQQSGNLPGAYLRTKDAVKLQPQAADAHFALAEVAQKMNKRDEAIAEYNKYLELEPDGDQVKTARKALEKLKP